MANLTDLELSNVTLFSFQNESDFAENLSKWSLSGLCKTYPDDPYWPFPSTWSLFNILLGGGLTETIPYAASCYDTFGNRNTSKCDFITNNWINASIYQYDHVLSIKSRSLLIPNSTEDPTSVNAVLFQGATCMPPTLVPSKSGCTIGGYPTYSVSIRNVAQIQLAVNFARNLNLRLVIKNTGHDFSAKSVGMGALSIWTHNLKDIRFFKNYRQGRYSGPAFKLGVGVQAFEAYEAARKNNVTIIGGEGRVSFANTLIVVKPVLIALHRLWVSWGVFSLVVAILPYPASTVWLPIRYSRWKWFWLMVGS